MKTVKLIALAIFSLAVLNSCTEENPEKWYTDVFKVDVRDWVLVGAPDEIGSYYEYVFYDVPYVNGIINVYMYVDYGTSSEIQIPLPYTDYRVEVDADGRRIPYSIQYTYDIAKDGSIAFKIYVNDYWTKSLESMLLTEHFRVAIIY
jgi:hypothetical protein